MITLFPKHLGELFTLLFEFIDKDSKRYPANSVCYYFRGEKQNFEDSSSCYPSEKPPIPRLFLPQNKHVLRNEKKYFYETLLSLPEMFEHDEKTIDKLARMQHYGYLTRLLDVTRKLPTAMAMLLPSQAGDKSSIENTGFIHVYRVREDRLKYSNSDTAIIISNLARVSDDQIVLEKGKEDLGYLLYECQAERPASYFDKDDHVGKHLISSIQHIWCVRPLLNSPRIKMQRGEFFLYGCRDHKAVLEATFSEADYDNPDAPSHGLARICSVAISPDLKAEFQKRSTFLDLDLDRIYPDFQFHSQVLEKQFQ